MSISVGPGKIGNSRDTSSSQNNEDIEAQLIPAGRFVPFIVVTVLFFLWAIPNNLNDILIRQFMKSFNIDRLKRGGNADLVLSGLLSAGHSGRPIDAALRI